MFHSIVNGFSCVKLPDYIKPFQGSRLRRCHLDSKSFVSTIQPKVTGRKFESVTRGTLFTSFFYRTHILWNTLPISIREIIRPSQFKNKLLDHLWKNSIKNEYDKFLEETLEESCAPFLPDTVYSLT